MIAAADAARHADEAARLEDFARRRLAGEPVARIVGSKEFWGLPLQLSAATLVPRPDTETVVELALEMLRAASARSGSADGASPISAPARARSCWRCCRNCRTPGVGTDISVAALRTARRNAVQLGLAARAAFVACDYAAALSGQFDLIVSNPPYIRSADIAGLSIEVRDHDPLLALDGGADGLDAYRALIPQAARLLGARRRAGGGSGAWPERRHPGIDRCGRVNARTASQGRSGGHPAGGRGPKKAPIKPDWDAKKPLGIFPGSDYVPATTSVQGCWPRSTPRFRDIADGGQSSQSESPPE